MPGPLLAIAANAGVRLAGAGIARLVAGKPQIPDVINPAINAAQAQLTDAETQQQRQFALADVQAAKAGGVGFAGNAAKENILNANAAGNAALRGGIMDTLARARQQQELITTEMKNQQRAELIQGITGGFNAAGSGLGSLLAGDSVPADAAAGTSPIQLGIDQTNSAPQIGLSALPSLSSQFGTPATPQFVPGISNVTDPNVFAQRLFNGLQLQ